MSDGVEEAPFYSAGGKSRRASVREQVMTGHEGMRLLILSRFEDDVLLRQEVEAWLDELAPLGRSVMGVPGLQGRQDEESRSS